MIAKTLLFSGLLVQCIYGLSAIPFFGSPLTAAEYPFSGPFGYGYANGCNGLATSFGFDGIAGPIGYANGPLGFASGAYGYGGLATPFAYDGLPGPYGYGAFGHGVAVI